MRINTLVKKYSIYVVLLVTLLGYNDSLYSQCPTVTNAAQSFCDKQLPTIASLVATDEGGGIKWYANATGGTALSSATGLINGEDYFADDNTGACGARQSVVVTIYSTPIGFIFQGVCVTNANLATPSNPQFVISGNGLRWYTGPSGGSALSPTAVLSDNTIYYISQTNPSTGCETSRLQLLVNVGIVPVPNGLAVQDFCSNTSPTVNDLVATGDNNWYLTSEFGIPLDLSTPLVNGQHYYATTVDPPCESSNRLDVLVNIYDPTVPVFTDLGPYCQNATPGTLPTTSTNGITGTWSAAVISTSAPGTQTYTFTPTVGLCATTTTISITVNPNIIPVFTDLGPYCQNATPGTLPTTSTNGITGTWSPAVISTTTLGTQTYTFTPTVGLCATTTTMSITVNPNIIPVFTDLGPYCQNATPGTLPTTSTNGITGTWSPAIISTTTLGTQTYTFTPTVGLCATTTTMSITVNPNIIPLFTDLGPYCQNATPGTLPTTSTNGITGTWSPAVISTTTLGTQTYTFTPTVGLCATTTTMSITVNPNIIPLFTDLGPYCQNATPGTLPTTSTNGITGTWSAAVISTSAPGTQTYTFTPTVGLCATTTTMSITVNPNIIPLFTDLGPYCQNATPGTLPTTSTNGITGTWSAAVISTSAPGTQTYTFTPTVGLCATTTTMSITVNPNIIPVFTDLGPYCQNATPGTLPTTSTNGITGTWSAAVISTSAPGTQTYTFTPTVGLCATTTTMSITVNPNIIPVFTDLGPYCQNATPGTLPTTSTNGITGTWSAAVISTSAPGTQTYTFTPTFGLCATTTTMSITVNPNIIPLFTDLGPYCQNATPGTLPTTSTNGITGTWSPAVISTSAPGTQTYTFTPTVGLCATTTTMSITVNPNIIPVFTDLGPYCQNATPGTLPTTSTNGITGTWSAAVISTSAPGTQTYTFTPTVGLCATTTTMSITVSSILNTGTAISPPSVCTSLGTIDLNTLLTGQDAGGTWSTPSPIDISNFTAGTYTYTYSITNVCGTNTEDVQFIVLPNPILTASNIASSIVCIGLDVPVNLSGMVDGTYTLNYDLNGSNTLINQNVTVVISGGIGSFTIPTANIPNSGSTTINFNTIQDSTNTCQITLNNVTGTITINPKVQIENTNIAASTICIGSVATVVISNATNLPNGVYQFNYSIPTGTSATGTSGDVTITGGSGQFTIPASVFTTVGNYTLTINSITTTTGCSNTTEDANITFAVVASLSAGTFTGVTSVCPSVGIMDLGALLTGESAGGVWTDSASQFVTSPINIISFTAGTYSYTYTVTNTCGTDTEVVQFTVYPNPQLTTLNISTSPRCVGTNSTVNLSGMIDGTYTLNYDLNGSNILAGQTVIVTIAGGIGSFTIPIVSIPNVGTTVITFTSITNNATTCTNTLTNVAAQIIIRPIADIDNANLSITNVCFGSNVVVNITSAINLPDGVYQFNYSIAGATPVAGNSGNVTITSGIGQFTIPSTSFTIAGNYTLTVTGIVTATGCSNLSENAAANFTVNPIPNIDIVTGVNISAQATCPNFGSLVTISGANNLADGNYSITYQLAGANTSAASVLVTFTSGVATFTIPSTDLPNLGDTTITITQLIFATTTCGITGTLLGPATFTVTALGTPVLITDGNLFCGGLINPTIANLSANIVGIPNVIWYDAPTGGTAYNDTDVLVDGTTYYATLVAASGCESAVRLAVTVTICTDVIIPDGFSPNNDGINDTFEIPNLAVLFPNFKLDIYNRYGSLIYSGNRNKENWDGTSTEGGLNLGDKLLATGVYFYILNFNDGTRKAIQGRLYLNR
jgi:mucin-2